MPASYALILEFNALRRAIWGRTDLGVALFSRRVSISLKR